MRKIEISYLPEGLDPDSLVWLVAPDLWRKDREKALLLALRRCGRLDCVRYLKDYPDVAAAGMEADIHFVRHGWREGRKIHLKVIKPVSRAINTAIKTNDDEDRQMANLKEEVARLREENHLLLVELDKFLNEDDR